MTDFSGNGRVDPLWRQVIGWPAEAIALSREFVLFLKLSDPRRHTHANGTAETFSDANDSLMTDAR